MQTLEELIPIWNALPQSDKDIILAVLSAIGFIVLLFFTLRLSSFLINRYGKDLEVSTRHSLKTLLRITILLLFLVAFLNQFPQFSGSLLGFSALIGTAIGFASTSTVGNMISGIYLMISRPFVIGDYVILPKLGFEGIVRNITINYTKIAASNGTTSIITNKTILDTPVINTRLEIVEKPQQQDGDGNENQFDEESMASELKQFYRKYSTKKSTVYVYPITFSVAVTEKQEAVNQAIKKLEQFLETNVEGVRDMNSRMVARTRVEVKYELSIMVEKSFQIFRIVSTALDKLEIFLEEVS